MFLFFSHPVVAVSFVDEFSNIDSLQHYTVYPNGGSVSIDSGSLKLSSPYANRRFPYLTFNDNLLVKPYKNIEISFRYLSLGRFGAGISVDDNYPVNGTSYDIGHQSLIWTWNWDSPPKSRFGYYSFNYQDLFPQNDFHILSISGYPGSYSIYLDNVFLKTITSTKFISSLWFGNPEIVNTNDSWPTLLIDKITITDSSVVPPTFPYLSQNNPLWGSREYDSANEWAGIDKSGIDRWGCALTSVAMILQKNGVKTIDSNADVNPDNLNIWLKRQPDGYIGSGLINWLAITRYAKESFAVGHSPTKLEYIRSYLPTTPMLPAILGLPGHFVLAYGEDLLNWNIHDPDDEMKTSLPKTSSIKSINRFIPSNTDLSYFLFTSNVPLNTVLTDTNGHAIPMTWIAENIVDDIGGSPGPILYTAMIPKPTTGAYILDIAENNMQLANFELLLYDKEGRVKTDNFEIKLGDSQYKIDYNSDLVENCKTSEIDIAAPDAPSLISPQNEGLVNSTNLALNWDSVSDVSVPIEYEYKYADKAGFTTNTSIDISNWADGIYNWSVRACDALSNCSPWTIEWSFEIDSTAPTYLGTNDFEGWHQTPQLALFQYADMHLTADYDPPSCQINDEGSNQQCIVYPSLCDKVGNCNTDSQISKSANIDLSAPISTIDIPTEIANWDGKIKGTAIDNLSGVKKVELKISMPDNTVMNVTTSGTDNWEYSLTKPTTGKYIIESIATDVAGNIQTQEMKVTITNTNPVAKLLNPPKIVIADDFGHLIGATWSGVGSAKKYFIYLGKSPNDLNKIYETKYKGWVSHKLESGRYYLGITALDKDGNESKMSRIVKVEIKRRLFWWRW
jgi:hypothetical protein